MKTINGLNLHWMPHRQEVSPSVIFHMLVEVLFPRKTVALGYLLFLLSYFLLMIMVIDILQASFTWLLLALIIALSGVSLWLVGYTS